MNRTVWIDGNRHVLDPAALLGQGGEAEVYDLHDGRVLKWWKPPEHPDFDGMPDAQAAAARRIADQPAKLRALPAVPASVVAPCGFALPARRATAVCGYLMPKVGGTPLHSFGEPRWRREHPVAGADVVAALLALHEAIAGLHRAGVVVGDCNDLNVLVDGRQVHLIDVDSYQFASYACSMFSERFVDPRLCDAQQLVPVRPHDVDSDWFAFAVMAFRSLFGVSPYGGVHQPAEASRRCPAVMRTVKRVSVLGPDIVYPRAARPLAMLPDDVLDVFRGIFERDVRGAFPRVVLERLRLRACPTCGDEHARVRCPTCQTLAHVPPAVIHGRLRWQPIPIADVRWDTQPVGSASASGEVWLSGDALLRRTILGQERIGSVLAGQTRAWVGRKLGVGFYRAGGYAVGFVFRPDRGLLDDRVTLPKLRGRIVDAHAVVGDDRAWLWLTCVDAGRLAVTGIVIGADARVLATETLVDAPWAAGLGGACAAGPHLFVPTDDGIARIEVAQGTITQTRLFAETAPLVSAGDRLSLHAGGREGIAVVRVRDAIQLSLT